MGVFTYKRIICPNCFTAVESNGVCPYCLTSPADAVNPAPTLPLGTMLNNRYRIGMTLGLGGFGITYMAWDAKTNKRVAVKEFFPKDQAKRARDNMHVNVAAPEIVSQYNYWMRGFLEEAKILVRLKDLHGIVKLLDFFELHNTAYIVMDYLDGQSLRAYLTMCGFKIPYSDAINILRPVLESLAILHSYGVIHRDVSPENIMLVQNKYVKLIDFGAACLYKTRSSEKSFTVLKPGYSPIELYRADEFEQGPFTDVYQMGATLYNCITGYIPAAAPERENNNMIPYPSSFGAAVSPQVDRAILRALAFYPEDRYQTVGEFVAALGL